MSIGLGMIGSSGRRTTCQKHKCPLVPGTNGPRCATCDKEGMRRYRATKKGKEAVRRYRQSEKGRAASARCREKCRNIAAADGACRLMCGRPVREGRKTCTECLDMETARRRATGIGPRPAHAATIAHRGH